MKKSMVILCAMVLLGLHGNLAYGIPVTWGDISFSPNDAIELDEDDEQKVTRVGNTIGVITELAAVNESDGIVSPSDILAVIGSLLTGDTINALAGTGQLLDSIVENEDSATLQATFQVPVSLSKPVIKDVGFLVQGAFITQKKVGYIWTDISEANIEGKITFGGKEVDVTFTPGEVAGDTEQPTSVLFSGKAHIDIDPVSAALFSFTTTMNAFEAGGPYDSFSAAIITRWEATASLVPEPATMLLLGSGLIGLVGFRRRFRKR